VKLYGGYPAEPFHKLRSDAMVVVARKPHTPYSQPRPEPVSALDCVPIRENGEPLVDLAVVAPEIELRDKPTWGRKTTVEMLQKATGLLPKGHKLKVRMILRTMEHQRRIYEEFVGRLAEKHPEWPKSQLRREANKFLAPPDAKHPPGHTTGGAVDLTILGPDGEELDMISSLRCSWRREATVQSPRDATSSEEPSDAGRCYARRRVQQLLRRVVALLVRRQRMGRPSKRSPRDLRRSR
jgi:D-alanyl-D-alanine dipeptidase